MDGRAAGKAFHKLEGRLLLSLIVVRAVLSYTHNMSKAHLLDAFALWLSDTEPLRLLSRREALRKAVGDKTVELLEKVKAACTQQGKLLTGELVLDTYLEVFGHEFSLRQQSSDSVAV